MIKTAVIYCVNSHGSKNAKIIKRWYYSASRWHLDDGVFGRISPDILNRFLQSFHDERTLFVSMIDLKFLFQYLEGWQPNHLWTSGTTRQKNWRILSNIFGYTGPIFAIFSPYESALCTDDGSVLYLSLIHISEPTRPY